MRNLKNLYIIIRYFGFGYFKAVYKNFKADKEMYDNFWECLQDELYAMADCQ